MNQDFSFLTYKKFTDEGLANELIETLQTNKVEYEVEKENFFDPSFSFRENEKEIAIKIRKEDFNKVNDLLSAISSNEIESISKDYYLYDFSDEELLEVITKQDEWSEFDFLLAQKILKIRGKEINPELLNMLKKQRIEEKSKPAENQRTLIFAGYIISLLGGFFAIFIGTYLLTYKKTLPDGNRVYGFEQHDRNHGIIILILGIIFFVMWTVIRFYR
jgi:hypothetical protein